MEVNVFLSGVKVTDEYDLPIQMLYVPCNYVGESLKLGH